MIPTSDNGTCIVVCDSVLAPCNSIIKRYSSLTSVLCSSVEIHQKTRIIMLNNIN